MPTIEQGEKKAYADKLERQAKAEAEKRGISVDAAKDLLEGKRQDQGAVDHEKVDGKDVDPGVAGQPFRPKAPEPSPETVPQPELPKPG